MQIITLRDTNETFRIQDEVYPFLEMGILYIRTVVVDNNDNPVQFLVIRPQDILYRTMHYDQTIMDEVIEESEKAIQHQKEMIEASLSTNNETPTTNNNYYG